MVEFIIARQEPGYPTARMLNTLSDDERAPYLDEDHLDRRDALIEPFRRLSPEALRKHHEFEKSRIEREFQPYSHRLTPLDAQKWLKKDLWEIEEAISLWVGFEPHRGIVKWAQRNRTLHDDADRIYDRADDAGRALEAQVLTKGVRPSDFLIWASKILTPDPHLFPLKASTTELLSQLRAEQECNLALRKQNAHLVREMTFTNGSSRSRILQMFAAACIEKFDADLETKPDSVARTIGEAIINHTYLFEASEPDTPRRAVKRLLSEATPHMKKHAKQVLTKLNHDVASKPNVQPS